MWAAPDKAFAKQDRKTIDFLDVRLDLVSSRCIPRLSLPKQSVFFGFFCAISVFSIGHIYWFE
jgi:hypothetical protein